MNVGECNEEELLNHVLSIVLKLVPMEVLGGY